MIGVLLTALGSPDRLEEMEEYLLNIRHGRTPSPEFVEEIKARYKTAGGRSPLLDITRRQAEALQSRLNSKEESFKVYVGMRHWHPYISSVMRQMANDGIRKVISLPLTPYDSKLSLQAYHDSVKQVNSELNLIMEIAYAKSWHKHPLLIASFAELLEKAMYRMRQKEVLKPAILFTAHSLPERILKENDPYPNQWLETASLVAKEAGLLEWNFAYQSQGGSQEPWLGPKVEEMLDLFAARGVSHVLMVPIGFVCDHMEILYDIDILFKNLAKEKGIELDRTASLNDSPKFIEALESVVHENAGAFAPARIPLAT